MTDEQLQKRGFSIPIFRAIEAAGGPPAVAARFGMKTAQMPAYQWPKLRNIPARYITPLCEMGGNAIRPEQILAEVAQAAEQAAA